MPDERVSESPRLNPALSRQHLFVLLPILGLAFVWRARAQATDEADRAELTTAVRCQMGGALVWLVHIVLQLAILGVWWLAATSPGAEGMLEVTEMVVLLGTVTNVVMWVLEWGVLVLAGIRASRGKPYPLSRRERRRAVAQARAEARRWKPLDDV